MTKRHKEEDTFTVIDRRGVAAEEAKTLSLITDLPRNYADPRPRAEYLLIKANAKQTVYRGTTFVIPEVAQESPNMGVVVGVGRKVDPEEVKVGDLVTFSRYNVEDIEVDSEIYKLCSVHDIKLIQEVSFAVAKDAN